MIIRAIDRPTFSASGFTMHGMASPERGSRELSSWRLEAPPGAASPAHTLSREELFIVMQGRLRITIDGVEEVLGPGDAATVHPGRELQVANPFEETAEAIVCIRSDMSAFLADGTPLDTPPWAR